MALTPNGHRFPTPASRVFLARKCHASPKRAAFRLRLRRMYSVRLEHLSGKDNGECQLAPETVIASKGLVSSQPVYT